VSNDQIGPRVTETDGITSFIAINASKITYFILLFYSIKEILILKFSFKIYAHVTFTKRNIFLIEKIMIYIWYIIFNSYFENITSEILSWRLLEVGHG